MNTSNNNLPSDFAHPGGFVEKCMNFMNETAVCEQPMFALASSLTLAGTLYGQHFMSADGQRTNIFCTTSGKSSAGKGHYLTIMERIFDECDATHLRLGQVTSDSAIEWALKEQSRLCLIIDEAGHYFTNINDPRSGSNAQHAIKPALLELWSKAGSVWKGKQRVPRDGKTVQPPTVIRNPHICLYATTQPQILFDSMTSNDLRDGWLARNLFFISNTRPMPQPKGKANIPDDIRLEVQRWKNSPDSVTLIPTSAEANAVFNSFSEDIFQKMVRSDKSGDETNYLYGKARENAGRVALILAVSRNGKQAIIEEADAVYATKLVGYLINDLISIARDRIGDTPDEKTKKRIMRIVAQSGRDGILKGDLTRKSQFINRRLRDEYLSDLVESGELTRTEEKNGAVRFTIHGLA